MTTRLRRDARREPRQFLYADGFHPVAFQFAKHLQDGDEIGASLAVYHRGTLVVDLS